MIAREPDLELRRALRHLARRVGLPELGLTLGQFASVKREEPDYRYSDLYPRMAYRPQGGFIIDYALLHAIARTETGFRPETETATHFGLLQISSAAADFLANQKFISPYCKLRDLKRPRLNIAVTETYLAYLLSREAIDGDLIRLLAAYHATPSLMSDWVKQAGAASDGLLLLESLPVTTTRNYVEQVLSALLLYRIKFSQERSNFMQLARGGQLLYNNASR